MLLERQLKTYIVLPIMLLAPITLSACQTPLSTSTPTQVPTTSTELPASETVPLQASPTVAPTLAGTNTPNPTRTPTLESLPINVPDDFFFGFGQTLCQYPCWQGITIGKSTVDEALMNLVHTYGTPFEIEAFGGLSQIVGLSRQSDAIRLRWIANDSGFFHAIVLYDESNRIVQGYKLIGSSSRFTSHFTLEQILEHLGTPQEILFSDIMPYPNTETIVHMIVIYDNGLSFDWDGIPPIEMVDSANEAWLFELCLSEEGTGGLVAITEPYLTNSSDLSLIQRYVHIGDELAEFTTFEDLFGITLEELTESAQTETNPCFYASLE